MDYLCYCKSEVGNVSNPVEDHCLQAMKSCITMPMAVLIG